MNTYVGSELIGPFVREDEYTLAYEGKIIPYVKGQWIAEPGQEPQLWIKLDQRMLFGPYTENEVKAFMPLLANAMAFSAGYPCHGSDLKMNRHNCGIVGISIPPKLTIVKPEGED